MDWARLSLESSLNGLERVSFRSSLCGPSSVAFLAKGGGWEKKFPCLLGTIVFSPEKGDQRSKPKIYSETSSEPEIIHCNKV